MDSWEQAVFLAALCCLTICKVSEANESQNFVITTNTRLVTQPDIVLLRKDVVSQLTCGLWCSRTPLCRSFNLEKENLAQNGRKCELLSLDKTARQDLVEERSDFDHYSSTDPCKHLSCLNGGTCVMSKTGFGCACTVGYEGVNCQLISECVHYSELSDVSRNIKHGLVSKKCDNKLARGNWYRFVGPAGSRMLDSCPVGKCDTDFQGWLQGGQPNAGDVRVTRTVCQQGNNKCCNWPSEIATTHCGDFIVYQLKPTNCYVRYCGVD